MRVKSISLTVLVMLATGQPMPSAARSTVELIETAQVVTPPRSPGQQVEQVGFDRQGRPFWNSDPLPALPANACPDSAHRPLAQPRRVLLGQPRVEHLTCPNGTRVLLGWTGDQLRWRASLQGDAEIIGASEDALVDSHLGVRAPGTGQGIETPVMRGARPDGTGIPRYRIHSPTLYRPRQRDFILFDPDHWRFGQAGLYLLDSRSGQQELLWPLERCGPLGLWGAATVRDLRTDVSGHFLFLHRQCQGRGHPGWHALSVFDTVRKTPVFEQRFEREAVVALAQAGNGVVAVATLPDGRNDRVDLRVYRLTRP